MTDQLGDEPDTPPERVQPRDLLDDGVSSRQPPAKKKMNPLVEWLVVVAVAITSALLVRAYVVQQFAVEGESMINTLQDGDRVLVNRLSYRLHDPRRGDVVVLKRFDGNATERDLIKRVIGLPGEVVEVRNCNVLIDGRVLNEPYLDPEVVTPTDCGGDYSANGPVPEDHVFVLGDNRGGSQDSRVIGPISEDDLVGRAFVVFWPQSHWQWL
jgi:signal peptidase I